MNNNKFGFSLASSLMIILFFLTTNLLTSSGHPWFIYPTFAVLWWPIGIYFGGSKRYKALSIAGSLLIISFFATINFVTSPGHPWFIYPTFAILWWPLGIFLGKRNPKIFSVVGSLLIITFFAVINFVTSPKHPWFIYPTFAILWWPLGILLGKKNPKVFSIVGGLLIITFFATINLITSSGYLWFIYPSFAILWWPLAMFLSITYPKIFSLIGSLSIIAFVVIVNMTTSRMYPWFIYPTFAILWWPLAVLLKNKKKLFSILGSALIIVFLVISNYFNSNNYMESTNYRWLYYSVFPILWWPIITIAGEKVKSLKFSIISSLIILAYYTALNITLSPQHPWVLYLVLPVLWWPISLAVGSKRTTITYAIVSSIAFIGYYLVLNILLSPSYPWSVYLIYCALWLSISYYCLNKKKHFSFSIAGSILTIIFFILINYINSPNHIWAVYPIFAILWWPLSVYYFKVKKQTT